MSKQIDPIIIQKIEGQLKPIFEDLTLSVLRNKPDNIVRNIIFYFNQPLFMVKYLQKIGKCKSDLTEEQEKEIEELQKEYEKYKEIELIEKSHSDSDSNSEK